MSEAMVRIPRVEHERLRQAEATLEAMQRLFFSMTFMQPVSRDPKVILKAMKQTKKYSPAFLKSVATGLKESSYFQQ